MGWGQFAGPTVREDVLAIVTANALAYTRACDVKRRIQ
jgi:hypothetical protein